MVWHPLGCPKQQSGQDEYQNSILGAFDTRLVCPSRIREAEGWRA